jgi:hypothetical protein
MGRIERKGWVRVNNLTGRNITDIRVVHRYSDVYEDVFTHTLPILAPGESTGANFTVRFRTGLLSTGQDWWSISYVVLPDAEEIGNCTDVRVVRCRSNPLNLRGFVDVVERVAWASCCLLTFNEHALLKGEGGLIFGPTSTAGFKKHTLREGDATAVTTIELHEDGRIHFRTPSDRGNSWINNPCLRDEMVLPVAHIARLLAISCRDLSTRSDPASRPTTTGQYDIYVNQLLRALLSRPDHDQECCICLEKNDVSDAVRHEGTCRAVFHSQCFLRATAERAHCPFCRLENPRFVSV